MAQRNGVSPQDLVQEQKKNPFKKAKWMMFRGPPHQTVPSSKSNNAQELDLKGQEDSIPARPKTEGKDIGGPSWVKSLAFAIPPMTLAVPLIMVEPFPPVSPKSHRKATPVCPGQTTDAALKKTSKVHSMLATEHKTSSETGLEPSSEGPQGEASEAKLATPVWAIKAVSAPWKRKAKVYPALPTESKMSPRVLSEPSFNWAQGEGPPPQEDSPVCAKKGVGAPWKRPTKVSPALPTESKISSRVLSEPSFNWAQGEGPPPQEASPVCATKEVSAPWKRTAKVSPALPTESKICSRVLSEPSFNWAQGEGPPPQEASPVCTKKGVSDPWKRPTKVSPALPTESKTSARVISKPPFYWAQGEGPPPKQDSPVCHQRSQCSLEEDRQGISGTAH
ncbi:uncharacterized protein LOC116419470 [Sarcophilus harrisii]|uniref:uncharacterized protein LOC116419470 n=1 Tax=Sarcophilus harrisii TaxID=9305 RepID=UPI001301D246|nr:uncharacterized protein LOC116419470 [Sarcophilus harrisii]